MQLEPQVWAQSQVQLELEQRRQQSRPKLQLHRHHCKEPDRSQEPQRELRQMQARPKALDTMTQSKEWEPQVQREPVLGLELVLELEPQEQLGQESELSELHVFLERLPLRQGSMNVD